MTADHPILRLLLVEDDEEDLDLLIRSLPRHLDGFDLRWETCRDLDEAVERVSEQHYDIVVSDIYRDRTSPKKDLVRGDPRGTEIATRIRSQRFAAIVLFTNGTFPTEPSDGPFIKKADKSSGNDEIVSKLRELIATGVPGIARRLHDELDRYSGSYLWGFLESNWSSLASAGLTATEVLERLLRRRAAIQMSRLDPSAAGSTELDTVEGGEFYIHPPISAKELRLGELLRRRDGTEFRVILTPHCHLTVQPGRLSPKADFVLTARTVPAQELFVDDPVTGATEDKQLKRLGGRFQSPADFGVPRGRYWFLPGFLEMPHLYVDLMQVESLKVSAVNDEYQSFAVLDTPFAEALQSCFVRFYSAVGLPTVKPDRFRDLLP